MLNEQGFFELAFNALTGHPEHFLWQQEMFALLSCQSPDGHREDLYDSHLGCGPGAAGHDRPLAALAAQAPCLGSSTAA